MKRAAYTIHHPAERDFVVKNTELLERESVCNEMQELATQHNMHATNEMQELATQHDKHTTSYAFAAPLEPLLFWNGWFYLSRDNLSRGLQNASDLSPPFVHFFSWLCLSHNTPIICTIRCFHLKDFSYEAFRFMLFRLPSPCLLCSCRFTQCWGRGWYGALGVGDEEDRGDQSGSMGDNLPYLELGTGKVAVAPALGVAETIAPTPAPTLPPTLAPSLPPTSPGVSSTWVSLGMLHVVVSKILALVFFFFVLLQPREG